MGMIADNAAEVVERTRNDLGGAMTDLRHADLIELTTGPAGQVQVNVDGVCLLNLQRCEVVIVDTTNALSTDRAV